MTEVLSDLYTFIVSLKFATSTARSDTTSERAGISLESLSLSFHIHLAFCHDNQSKLRKLKIKHLT